MFNIFKGVVVIEKVEKKEISEVVDKEPEKEGKETEVVDKEPEKIIIAHSKINWFIEIVMFVIYMGLISVLYYFFKDSKSFIEYIGPGLAGYILIHGSVISVKLISESIILTNSEAKAANEKWMRNIGHLTKGFLILCLPIVIGFFVLISVIDIPNVFVIVTVLVESFQIIYETYVEMKE